MGTVADYAPTVPELLISLGIYAVGVLLLTLFYKIVLSVRAETDSP
jgi:molybdopterin-containing oxidoreductase family membrane subunit